MDTQFAPITVISKFRMYIIEQAEALGWEWTQTATQIDRFDKGTEEITATYNNRVLKGFRHMSGESLKAEVVYSHSSKLQLLQTALGRPMPLAEKWDLPDAQK